VRRVKDTDANRLNFALLGQKMFWSAAKGLDNDICFPPQSGHWLHAPRHVRFVPLREIGYSIVAK
jgi:hypothetical protein